MNKLIIYLVAYLLLCIAAPSYAQNSSRKNLQKADSLFLLAEYDQTISLLSTVTSSDRYYYQSTALISECYARKGDYDKAYSYFPPSGTTIADTLQVLFEQTDAFIELNKGRSDLALEKYLHVREVFEKTSMQKTLRYARCLNNIGLVYWTTGNTSLALETLEQSLLLKKELLGKQSVEVAATLNNIGLLYSDTEPETAERYYLEALAIYQTLFPPDHPSIALAYGNLGVVYRKQKKYEQSIKYFEDALSIQQKRFGEVHPTIGFIYNNIGQTYLDKGDDILTKVYFEKGQDVYRKIYGEKNPEVAYGYTILAGLELKKGKYDEALKLIQKALISNTISFKQTEVYKNPDSEDYYNGMLLLSTLQMKAQAIESRYYNKSLKYKDLSFSLQTLEVCDTLIDKIRQVLISHKDKIALGKTSVEVFENSIRVSYALSQATPQTRYYLNKAFYFSEKNKSAVLLEAISETNAKSYANIPSNLLNQEQELKATIAWLEQRLAAELDESKKQEYKNQLFKSNEAYRQFIQSLEKSYPQYFNLKYNIHTPTVAEIQKGMDDKSELISYFIAENSHKLYIFTISAKHFEVIEAPLKEEYNKMITGMRNAIKIKGLEGFTKTSTFLHEQLFPFNIEKKATHLIIIPDGRLGIIPFEALIEKPNPKDSLSFVNMDYLGIHYAFSYNYSATLYLQGITRVDTVKLPRPSILICAPVKFNPGSNLNSLPGTETEATTIAEIFTAKNLTVKAYTFGNATEVLIKSKELGKYTFIHLATHGIVHEEKPELSQIYLRSDSLKLEDGDLYSGEIYNLIIRADLVTLSACQTGLGKVSKGEGIIGLSRALLFAGARNLVVSLWTVSDESTPILMCEFYKQVLQTSCMNTHYAYAMQQAKLSLMKNPKYASPYYWAPFILIGR